MSKRKVWGVIIHRPKHPLASGGGQVRAIVNAKSRAAAARLLHVPDSYLRDFGSDTGNALELLVCNEKPDTVFIRSINGANMDIVEEPKS